MTDRVMSATAQTAEQHAARTAELVGDGSKITAEQFATFGLAERNHLFGVDPERYRALQSEFDRATGLAKLGGGR